MKIINLAKTKSYFALALFQSKDFCLFGFLVKIRDFDEWFKISLSIGGGLLFSFTVLLKCIHLSFVLFDWDSSMYVFFTKKFKEIFNNECD